MTLIDRTATEHLADLTAGRISSVELTRAYLDQIDRHDGSRAGILAGRPSGGACPGGRDRSPPGGRATPGPPGRAAGGDQGRALHARRTDDLRVANPGELPPALRRHRDRPAEGGRRRADRQDEHGRVRHGRVERELGLSSHAQPLGLDRGFRAVPAAGRRPAWPRGWPRFRSAPTPAARSAAPRGCAASPG